MRNQNLRSALIAAVVAALVATPLAGADAIRATSAAMRTAVGGDSSADVARMQRESRLLAAKVRRLESRLRTLEKRSARQSKAKKKRKPAIRRGPTGTTGPTGAAGAGLDTKTIRWRAASPFAQVKPEDGVVRLTAECPPGAIAIDGGYLTGDGGGNIAVLGFERLASTFDAREGYVLWVRALIGSGHPQVRAYCADAP